MPSSLSIGTGFIVKSKKVSGSTEIGVSKQVDIIVYNNRIPVLFCEGDFIITTHTNVKATVEVKTKVTNSNFQEILRKSVENAKFMGNRIFNGIFAYDYEKTTDWVASLTRILEGLSGDGKYVDHMALGPQVFVKHWNQGATVNSDTCNSDFYGIYDFSSRANENGSRGEPRKLSFSYFISNLLYDIFGDQLSDRV